MADVKDLLINYYPSQRYADKKLAPEKISTDSIKSLAKAAKIARDQGLLRGDVIDLLLPNLMVEGREGDYGVNKVELANTPKSARLMKTLGLDSSFVKESNGRLGAIPNGGEQDYNAKLAVAAMSQKQNDADRLYGPEAIASRVIQLWNGKGPDSERHRERVIEASRMLKTDPANKDIKKLMDEIMGTLPSTPIDAENSQQYSAILESMVNNYDSSK